MNQQISDKQIRAACRAYGLDPVGMIPAELPQDMQISEEAADEGECLENDRCYEFVTGGEWLLEPGPLGFAAGHPSPGWQFLRNLCDRVAADDIDTDWFAAFGYDEARDHLESRAEDLARKRTVREALVCVADLGVDEDTETASMHLGERAGETGRHQLDSLAWTLLAYAGYLVLREVFTAEIDAKLDD